MASSRLYPGGIIINDSTPVEVHAAPEGFGKGLELPDPSERSYGGLADPFPRELLIPRNEWQARIQEKEQRKTRLSDIVKQRGIPSKNQASTLYCWNNAVTGAAEALRAAMNEPYVDLSSASVGGPLTNYRNVGGWARSAIQYISQYGIVPAKLWPTNAIDPRYHTAANLEVAAHYKITGWILIDLSEWEDQIASLVLRNVPVCIGLAWWGHEVHVQDLLWLDGAPAWGFRNSWGDQYGDHGYGVIQGCRMQPDDGVAPYGMRAAA